MNLFVVDSPLQLLNATEAKYAFGQNREENVLLILEGASSVNLKQIESLLVNEEWDLIKIIKANQNRIIRYHALIKINAFLRELDSKHVRRVFIGEYRASIFRHIANTCAKNAEVILLDDGSATLEIAQMRAKGIVHIHKHFLGRIRRWFDEQILGLSIGEINKLTFFSIYSGLKGKDFDKFKLNKYSKLRSRVKEFDVEEVIYFIGTPIVEMNIVSEEQYLNYLNSIKKDLKNIHKPIYYMPHRRENSLKLEKINEIFSIRKSSTPLEIRLLKDKLSPHLMVTFYSSVVDNILRIFGNKIPLKIYRIDSNDINEFYFEKVKGIYEYYEDNYKNDIEITDVKSIL